MSFMLHLTQLCIYSLLMPVHDYFDHNKFNKRFCWLWFLFLSVNEYKYKIFVLKVASNKIIYIRTNSVPISSKSGCIPRPLKIGTSREIPAVWQHHIRLGRLHYTKYFSSLFFNLLSYS